MIDIWSKKKRSLVMSAIRSRGNRETEIAAISLFRQLGINGWRRNQKMRLAGKQKSEAPNQMTIRPDFVFRENRVVIFVDGEFWHGHPTLAKIPSTRREWWTAKIEGNKKRDRLQNRILRSNGWTVVRIWQHELTRKHRQKALRKLRRAGLLPTDR